MWFLALCVNAQDTARQRDCRPQLAQMGMPEHFCASRRTPFNFYGDRQSLRRAESDNPLIGERRQLVVMAEYADQAFKGDEVQTLEQWDKILNTENYNEPPFHGSVHDYFLDQSYGQFSIRFDLYYATLPDSMVKYRSTYEDDENSKYLVQDVMEIIRNKVDDWAPYDWDSDGYVDQLLIVYAGKGQSDGGGWKTIWPHQWWLSKHKDCQPITVSSGGKDYKVDTYCCVQEIRSGGTYGSFGTLCHEYSHCFGLPDFYFGEYIYLGTWDVMDGGLYNDSGFRPCGYSAFERSFMGWMTPVELNTDTVVYDMPAINDQPAAYLIRNDGAPQEFYLVENRQQTEWDTNLPGSGIIVAHVDFDDNVFRIGAPNTPDKQRYLIFAANNKTNAIYLDHLRGWGYPYKENNKLTNTSIPAATLFNPNTDGSLMMSKPITQMAVDQGLASFRFTNPNTTAIEDIQWNDQWSMSNVQWSMSNDEWSMFNGQCSMNNGQCSMFSVQWFTLDGRRLNGKPTSRGIYIVNGHKVVLK